MDNVGIRTSISLPWLDTPFHVKIQVLFTPTFGWVGMEGMDKIRMFVLRPQHILHMPANPDLKYDLVILLKGWLLINK